MIAIQGDPSIQFSFRYIKEQLGTKTGLQIGSESQPWQGFYKLPMERYFFRFLSD